MQTSQLTVRLDADTLRRVDARRLPARPGEPIPNRTLLLRQAIDIGLDALEQAGGAGASSPTAAEARR